MKPYRFIQAGLGSRGCYWIRKLLPPLIEEGRLEPVAYVDVDPARIEAAQKEFGLPDERCYAELERAFDENAADFALVVTPPMFHEVVVDQALAHGCHVLSEKAIAHTLEAACRIAAKVRLAGRKMAVTMSHRFDRDKTALRQELRSGSYGQLDYLVVRFTTATRGLDEWNPAAFLHQMADPLLIEGSVHHLDIIQDLAGAPCKTVYAQTWNPAWGEYRGDTQALVTLTFGNGVRASYEGAVCNAAGLNGWAQEYVRAECEKATLILDKRALRILPHKGTSRRVPLPTEGYWLDTRITADFLDWLDNGEPSPTHVAANLESLALVYAAIESNRSGLPVDVNRFLSETREKVSLSL